MHAITVHCSAALKAQTILYLAHLPTGQEAVCFGAGVMLSSIAALCIGSLIPLDWHRS